MRWIIQQSFSNGYFLGELFVIVQQSVPGQAWNCFFILKLHYSTALGIMIKVAYNALRIQLHNLLPDT